MVNCINLLKISIKNKKKGFIVDKNIKNINILKSFLKINIIKFILFKDKKILVFINYKNNKPLFKNILNFYKTSHKTYINYKNLNKIIKKHNWLLILSTSRGIINSSEALRLRVGGLIIAKLWN